MVHLQTTSHPHISGESTVDTDCPQNMNQRFSGGGGVRQCREEMRGATTGRGMRGLAIIIPRILLLLAIVNSVLGGSTYIDENGVEVSSLSTLHSPFLGLLPSRIISFLADRVLLPLRNIPPICRIPGTASSGSSFQGPQPRSFSTRSPCLAGVCRPDGAQWYMR